MIFDTFGHRVVGYFLPGKKMSYPLLSSRISGEKIDDDSLPILDKNITDFPSKFTFLKAGK